MSAVPESPASLGRPLRLGFAGLGWIGRKRLDAVAEHSCVHVAALCDASEDALQTAKAAFPRAFAVANFEKLLEKDLDGIVIATPNALHTEQTLAALERGIAVFCQKPLSLSARDAARIVDAAKRADRLLAVDYCYRHVQGMTTLRDRIRNGELGKPLFVDMKFHNAYGPDKRWCYDKALSGGGCLLDLGVHLIDLALWLQDTPELEVVTSHLISARPQQANGAIEDVALAELRQSESTVVRLACSWNVHAGREALIEFAIYGTDAGAVWRNVDGSFYDFTLEWTHGTHSELLGTYPDDWGDRALRAWIDALSVDGRFDAAALSYVSTAKVIDALYRTQT